MSTNDQTPTPTPPLDLDAIRRRADAATPGPWRWHGNTDTQQVYLSTVRWGRQIVMSFDRWGMRGAQPRFVQGRTWQPNPEYGYDFDLGARLTKARDMAIYEVAPNATSRQDPDVYRADIRGLRNPDAEFIAAARQDVADLLTEVDRLRAELESVHVDLRATEQACDALREQLYPAPAKPSIELPDPWADRPYVEPVEPNLDAEYAGRMDAADQAAHAEDAERTGHGPRCQCEICRYIMTHHQDSEFVRDAIARQAVS